MKQNITTTPRRRRKMLTQLIKGSAIAACTAALLLAGCAQHHKQHHGVFYHGADTHDYTRSYDDSTGQFIYWMWLSNSTSSSSAETFTASSGKWVPLATMLADAFDRDQQGRDRRRRQTH